MRSPTSGNTGGQYNMTLTGANFGLTATVSIGGANCPVLSRNAAHTQLVCQVPPGQGSSRLVQVSVATQLSGTQ